MTQPATQELARAYYDPERVAIARIPRDLAERLARHHGQDPTGWSDARLETYVIMAVIEKLEQPRPPQPLPQQIGLPL